MQGITVDFTALVAVLVGGLLLLVPLAGMTLRYGVIPLLAAIGELRREWIRESQSDLTARISALESRVLDMEADARDEPGVRFA